MSQTTPTTSEFYFRTTKNGYKRPTVSVEYPVPTVEGLITLLQGEDEKVQKYIMETVQGSISAHVKGFVDADIDFNQDTMNTLVESGQVSIEHIAHIPKADRNVLNKDDLESFAEAYITIMPEATGKAVEKVKAAASLFVNRFKTVAGDQDILAILKEQLEIFMDVADTEVLEENEKVLSWATQKLDELLSAKITADSL